MAMGNAESIQQNIDQNDIQNLCWIIVNNL